MSSSSSTPIRRPSPRGMLVIALLALVALAAPARGAVVGLDTSATALTSTTPIDATAGLPAAGTTGGAPQVLTTSFDPAYLRLGGLARVTAPDGWTTTFSTDGTTFGAAPTTAAGWADVRAVRTSGSVAPSVASTGGSVSASVPAPASGEFPGTSGGDGWNVFFDDAGHVFNVWHHNGSPWPGVGYGTIDCHTRTGGTCGNGWPFAASGSGLQFNTGMHSAGWVDTSTGHLWFPTNTSGSGSETGFACVDVSNLGSGAGQGPAWCGGSAATAFRALGTAGPGNYSDQGSYCSTGWQSVPFNCVDGMAVVGNRLYTLEARTGKVLCLDMSAANGAGAACAGQPYVIPGMTAAPTVNLAGTSEKWLPALLNIEGHLFATGRDSYTSSTSTVYLACLDGTTGAACPGWASPKSPGDPSAASTTPWLTYAEPSASGAINGVCMRPVTSGSAGTPTCFDLTGASFTGDPTIGASFRHTVRSENASAVAATVGPRVYWGNGDYTPATSILYCSDAATQADCQGWPLAPTTAGSVPRDNYSITPDPLNDNCLWMNSDASGIYQYSSAGTRGCAGTPPGSATFTASNLVTQQRVSCTAQPSWEGLSLTSPAQGTYAAATLTVLDAAGQVVISGGRTWFNVPLAADGTINLSGLAQADTGPNPQFVVNLSGRTNSDPIATTLTTPSYPPQLCTSLTPQEMACPVPGAPPWSLQAWSSTVAAGGSQGGSPLASAQAAITFGNPSTAACAPPPPVPPAPSPAPSPSPTPSSTPVDPVPPRTSQPRLAASGRVVRSVVTVRGAGVVTQAGRRRDGVRACASRPITVRAAGSIVVTCRLRPSSIKRLRTGSMRIRLTTTLRSGDGVSTSTRTVTLRRTAVPVTG